MMLIWADQLAKAFTKDLRYTLLVRPYTSVPGTGVEFCHKLSKWTSELRNDGYSEQVGQIFAGCAVLWSRIHGLFHGSSYDTSLHIV